jgi:hypothetical protein
MAPQDALGPITSVRLTADLAAWIDQRPGGRHSTIKTALQRYQALLESVRPLPFTTAEAVVLLLCCKDREWSPIGIHSLHRYVRDECPHYGGQPSLGIAVRKLNSTQRTALVDSLDLYRATVWRPDQTLTDRVTQIGLTKGGD